MRLPGRPHGALHGGRRPSPARLRWGPGHPPHLPLGPGLVPARPGAGAFRPPRPPPPAVRGAPGGVGPHSPPRPAPPPRVGRESRRGPGWGRELRALPRCPAGGGAVHAGPGADRPRAAPGAASRARRHVPPGRRRPAPVAAPARPAAPHQPPAEGRTKALPRPTAAAGARQRSAMSAKEGSKVLLLTPHATSERAVKGERPAVPQREHGCAARRCRDPRPSAGARLGAERRPGRGRRCPPCAGRAALPTGGVGRAARHLAEPWDARTGVGVSGVGTAASRGLSWARAACEGCGGSGGRGLRAWRVPPGCAARGACGADRGPRRAPALPGPGSAGLFRCLPGESPVIAAADSAEEEQMGRCCRPFYWLLFSGSSSDGENSP